MLTPGPNTNSPNGGPGTPMTDGESPPKTGAGAGGGRGGKAGGAAKRGGKKAGAGGITKASPGGKMVDSPSPMMVASPRLNGVPPTIVEEETLLLKRKREKEEVERDPDSFIERTLREGGGSTSTTARKEEHGGGGSTRFLARDLTSHLPFDFEAVIPPVLESTKPLSFSVLNSSNPFPHERPPPFPPSSSSLSFPPTSSALPPPNQPLSLDFDFFIDSTAAGYDLDSPVETPELVEGQTPNTAAAGKNQASPPSDDEADEGRKPFPAALSYGATTATGGAVEGKLGGGGMDTPFLNSGGGTEGGEGFDLGWLEEGVDWVNAGQGVMGGLPETFRWEGELGPSGVWAIRGDA